MDKMPCSICHNKYHYFLLRAAIYKSPEEIQLRYIKVTQTSLLFVCPSCWIEEDKIKYLEELDLNLTRDKISELYFN